MRPRIAFAKDLNPRKAMRGRIALPKHFVRNLLPTNPRYGVGRGCGVGRTLGTGMPLGVGVGRGVEVGVAVGVMVAVAVGVGVIVGVGGGVEVGVGVGVGVGLGGGEGVTVGVVSDCAGATTLTVTGVPVLKKPMFAVLPPGGAVESNRKLYSVPKRMALAFWFCAKVSQFQVAEVKVLVKVQGTLLYPSLLNVPSFGQPGS